MGIGKAALGIFFLALLVFGMVAVLSIVNKDKTTDDYYNWTNTTVANSTQLTGVVTASATSFTIPLVIIATIVFMLAAFIFFRKVR